MKLQNQILGIKDDEDSDKEYQVMENFQGVHSLSAKEKKQGRIREYVDVIQSPELESAVRNLLYKLKELYFIRKTKPQKGKFKKSNAPPKKRYMIGLKEIQKNLCAKKLSMVIIATNIEKVEGVNGLDEYIY